MKVEYNGNGYRAEMGGMVSSVNVNSIGTNVPDTRWIKWLKNGVVLSIVGLIFSLSALTILLCGFYAKEMIIELGIANILTAYGIANIVAVLVAAVTSVIAFVFISKNKALSSGMRTLGITCGLIAIVIVIVVAAMIPGTFLI